MIDVCVPTIPGREDSLERLLASIAAMTLGDYSVYLAENSETCGAGWKAALERGYGEYVLLACDDQEFIGPDWDVPARACADKGVIACPRVWEPDGRIQSQGGDMDALRHVISRPQKNGTRVPYSTIPFMTRAMMQAIGMLEVHYASDVWASFRGAQLGYATELVHGFEVRHYREDHGRGAGMSEHDRNEMDKATVFEALAAYERTPA